MFPHRAHSCPQVISRACQLLQIPHNEAVRIHQWNIPVLRDLKYITREIHMFIEVGSVCSDVVDAPEVSHRSVLSCSVRPQTR